MNYVSINPPLCRQMSDLDRLCVQLAMSTMPPAEALGSLFAAFGQLSLFEACLEEAATAGAPDASAAVPVAAASTARNASSSAEAAPKV